MKENKSHFYRYSYIVEGPRGVKTNDVVGDVKTFTSLVSLFYPA